MKYLIIFLLITGCSAKFDGFNPTTSVFKWVITSEKK